MLSISCIKKMYPKCCTIFYVLIYFDLNDDDFCWSWIFSKRLRSHYSPNFGVWNEIILRVCFSFFCVFFFIYQSPLSFTSWTHMSFFRTSAASRLSCNSCWGKTVRSFLTPTIIATHVQYIYIYRIWQQRLDFFPFLNDFIHNSNYLSLKYYAHIFFMFTKNCCCTPYNLYGGFFVLMSNTVYESGYLCSFGVGGKTRIFLLG